MGDASVDPLLSAAVLTSALPRRRSRGSYPTPANVPHGVGTQDVFSDPLLPPWAAVSSCPLGLGRNSLADMLGVDELRFSSSPPVRVVYEPHSSSEAAAPFTGAAAP